MHGQLSIEAGKRVEAMEIVEATLILTVAALYLAIVTEIGRASCRERV